MEHRGKKKPHKKGARNSRKSVSEDTQEIWSEQKAFTHFFSPRKKIIYHTHNLAVVIFADMLARLRIARRLVQYASRE